MTARQTPPSQTRNNALLIAIGALWLVFYPYITHDTHAQTSKKNSADIYYPSIEDAKFYKLGDQIELYGVAYQGGWLKGKLPPEHLLEHLNDFVKIGKDGTFILGIPYQSPPVITLIHTDEQSRSAKYEINITQRDYAVQRIDGLPESKVTPAPGLVKRVNREFETAKRARLHVSDITAFDTEFIWPATGRISGRYGSQRILNGKPRTPHWGIDIANKKGTPILSPADGVVILLRPDMYFSGKTMIVDHGHGVISTFLHLNKIYVDYGTKVKKGQPIGSIGNSGRSTGPHLDWRISWRNQRIDAATFVSKK